VPAHNPVARKLARPVFSQPSQTEDPTTFVIKHASDKAAYQAIDQLNKEHKLQALPFPAPRGGVEPRLTLQEVLRDIDGASGDVRATAR
jgi:hypothetical protein